MAGEILVRTNMPGLGVLTIEKKEMTAVDMRVIIDGSLTEAVERKTSQVDRIVFYVEEGDVKKTVWSFTSPRIEAPRYGLVEPTKELNSSFNIVHYQYHADKGTLSLAWNVYNVLFATVFKTPPFPGEPLIEVQNAPLPVMFMNVKECRFKYIDDIPAVELVLSGGSKALYKCIQKSWRRDE